MPDRSPAFSPTVVPDEGLPGESLRHCSPATITAARIFRQTGNPRYLSAIVRGVLERHVAEDVRTRLATPNAELRLSEDLGIDSLALMELAIALEDAVGFRFEHEELRGLLTVGEIERALAARARGPA